MNEQWQAGIAWALVLAAALPLAIVLRISTRIPERVAETLSAKPWIARAIGAADVLLCLLVAKAAPGQPALQAAAFLLWVLLAALALAGLAGVAVELARRLRPAVSAPGPGTYAIAWLLVAGLALLPIFGWLALLWFATGGIGATLLSLRR